MEKSGIFDRNNYSKKTLDTFEILAAYFIDIYYNHLYIEAKKLRTNKSVNSITEGYKHALNAYMQGIENPKLYKKTLSGIHSYFETAGFGTITFSECIERITVEFIPRDYYSAVTKTQKTSLLKHVLCQSNKVFIEKMVKKFLALIIDNRKDLDNARILQDEFIDVLILERESVYHLFIGAQTKSAKKDASPVIIDSLRKEIKKLYTEKFELKKQNTLIKKLVLKKEDEINSFRNAYSELKNNFDTVQEESNELIRKNSELLHRAAELEHALHAQAHSRNVDYGPSFGMTNPHSYPIYPRDLHQLKISGDTSNNTDDQHQGSYEENDEENNVEESSNADNKEDSNNAENEEEYKEDVGRKINKEIISALKDIENKKIIPDLEQSTLFDNTIEDDNAADDDENSKKDDNMLDFDFN